MLFITIRSASPADVPKVLQVVEHVKRLRHKRGDYLLVLPYCPTRHFSSESQTSTRDCYPKT